ncbi:sensor histidine kinase [Microbispora sp. CA-135349]|uniref:sensor histidine kinase n=1 Tax=Microbispora sp. CA-135349 TaxID=3239953 RepID=UPI003D94B972
MRRWSVRVRATVVATVTVASALAVAVAVLMGTLKSSLESSAGQEAARRAETAVQALITTNENGATTLVTTGPAGDVAIDPDVRVSTHPEQSWGEGYATVERTVTTSGGKVTVRARSSLEPVRDALHALRPLLLVGTPVLVLLVAVLTWLLVGRALAPVSAIRTTFARITASDLHERVPVSASGDEVTRLAQTMNATLDRLERAVSKHRQFVADAAHELRSPLATLRTRLELGRREAPRLVREALTDVERIQGLAADLLLLARLDAGEPLRMEEVDLGQVATEEALRPRRDGVTIRLDVATDVVVRGSRSHLARLVANLVDNAVRHAETTVTVRVAPPGTVEVCDDGPGIPVEHHESVFDRFTRLDEARARDAGGSGLGLAIARDIARAHDGTLVVAGAAGPGARLRADLPPGDTAAG